MNTQRLMAFGIGDIVAAVVLWIVTGNAITGLALLAVGIAVLVVAAVARRRAEDAADPAASATRALRNEQADRQREHDETEATAENAEERPPPTGA